jgi:hypothetical protein
VEGVKCIGDKCDNPGPIFLRPLLYNDYAIASLSPHATASLHIGRPSRIPYYTTEWTRYQLRLSSYSYNHIFGRITLAQTSLSFASIHFARRHVLHTRSSAFVILRPAVYPLWSSAIWTSLCSITVFGLPFVLGCTSLVLPLCFI